MRRVADRRHRPASGTDQRVCSGRRVPDGRDEAATHAAAAGSVARTGVAASRGGRRAGARGQMAARWWRTDGRPSGATSSATRSMRSGSAGSGRPSGSVPRSSSVATARRSVARLRWSTRLLGEPEVTPAASPHLDHDERPRRPGVDRDEVELVPAHPHVAREDRPARRLQAAGDQRLARVTGPLRRGAGRSLHPRHPAAARSPDGQPALTCRSPAASGRGRRPRGGGTPRPRPRASGRARCRPCAGVSAAANSE